MSIQNCPELAVQTWDLLTEHNLTHRPIVVALSGGLDSMAMLRIMLELRSQKGIEFSAIHVNHGLSKNAPSWQSFVGSYCEINQIPLSVVELKIESKSRQSLEQLARNARYASIAELAPEHAVIATGHHLYDQVETFFLRLTRGSSAKGLSAMSAVGDLPNRVGIDKSQVLFRPLLKTSKSTLKDYAGWHHLEWIEDESNQDLSFDRNFIRHKVTSVLENRWPHFPSAIATSCEILAEESLLLEEYLTADLEKVLSRDMFGLSTLTIGRWRAFSKAKQVQLLRLFLKQIVGAQVSRNQVDQIIETIIESSRDKQGFVNIGKFQVRKHGEYLYCIEAALIDKRLENTSVVFESDRNRENSWIAGVPLQSALHNQATIHLQLINSPSREVDLSSKSWSLKFGMQNGLRIKPNQNSGHKKVTEFLKQQGCPAWLRDQVPLLFCDHELVAVIGYAVDVHWQPTVNYEIKRT